MSKQIYYITSFDIEANKDENRVNILSSANKINYIVYVLNQLGYKVNIVSTSHTLNKRCYSGKLWSWGNNTVKLFPTTWRGGRLLKLLNIMVMNTAIVYYILTHIKAKDTVIVYHSYGTMWINLLLRLKGVCLINECEEIYGDIFGKKWLSKIERWILRYGNKYIYPTKLLNSVVNKKNKPYLVIHGSYKDLGTKYFSDCSKEPIVFDPSLYHVAYTGILDPKKGCLDVIKAAAFLDEEYYIHILGFGSKGEINQVYEEINKLKSHTKCKISFDGVRRGREYTNYLSHINLGVCTLNPELQFTMTQFPSKIISYMAVGIPVLCSEAKAIKECEVSDAITFYSGNTPQDIANGIKTARTKGKIDTIHILEDCDNRLKRELKELICS
ncbi:MAG: glycosyltransferase family 4 protein [Bacteroides sp.]|nr:glycosyltransferase family 4 protein [Bacteroides sp.]